MPHSLVCAITLSVSANQINVLVLILNKVKKKLSHCWKEGREKKRKEKESFKSEMEKKMKQK